MRSTHLEGGRGSVFWPLLALFYVFVGISVRHGTGQSEADTDQMDGP